nr:hypothetical protein [Candidatus Sigynarchaeota archaeon]
MTRRQVKFFFLFEAIPLTPSVPLKALTSQGRRFDVACRMIRSSLLFDGIPTHNSVEAWFGSDGGKILPAILSIDGHILDDVLLFKKFYSELVLAKFLKQLAQGSSEVPGIEINALELSTDVQARFLDRMKLEKLEGRRALVALHETGQAMVATGQEGALLFQDRETRGLSIVIGNHQGIPPAIEADLLQACDHVLCLSTITPEVGSQSISYLGSHVIDMLNYCFL